MRVCIGPDMYMNTRAHCAVQACGKRLQTGSQEKSGQQVNKGEMAFGALTLSCLALVAFMSSKVPEPDTVSSCVPQDVVLQEKSTSKSASHDRSRVVMV